MSRLHLKKLVISGENHVSSIVEFVEGLNIILGPSNTGKSLVLDCIDYALGARSDNSKICNNSHGYKTVSLYLECDAGSIILNREINTNKIKVTSLISQIPSDTYSISSNSVKSINFVLLKLLGIENDHLILRNEEGKTQKFTFRTMLYLFLLTQENVARSTSALLSPSGHIAYTSSKAGLLYLLTNKDANDVILQENVEISKAKRNAIINFLGNKINNILDRKNELEVKLKDFCEEKHKVLIEELENNINSLQEQLDKAAEESKDLHEKLYDKNNQLVECNLLIEKFDELQKGYNSDIKRIEFIVKGKNAISKLPKKQSCPVCNSKIIMKVDADYIESSLAELENIKLNLAELNKTYKSVEERKEALINEIANLSECLKERESIITNDLCPLIVSFKENLDSALSLFRLNNELEILNDNETQYRRELFEIQNTNPATPVKHKINDYYDFELINAYETVLKDAMKIAKIPGANSIRFNMTNFDININNIPKEASMGGGYCAILNTMVAYTMGSYILSKNQTAPRFFIVDSALTQLSEANNIHENDTIKRNFIKYLENNSSERQVIIAEHKEHLPYIPRNASVNIIEFTRDKNVGRYGFLNDVYNVE